MKPKTIVVTQTLPDLPANLAAPCGESQDLKTGRGDEVLTLMIDDRRKLTLCSEKHKSVVDLWRDTQQKALK